MGFAVCCHNVSLNVDCTKALSLPVKRLLDACNARAALMHSMCSQRYGACKFNTLQGLLKHKCPTILALMSDALAYARNAVCMPSSWHACHAEGQVRVPAPQAPGLGKTGSRGEAAAMENTERSRCVTSPPNAAAGKQTQQSLSGNEVSAAASLTGSISPDGMQARHADSEAGAAALSQEGIADHGRAMSSSWEVKSIAADAQHVMGGRALNAVFFTNSAEGALAPRDDAMPSIAAVAARYHVQQGSATGTKSAEKRLLGPQPGDDSYGGQKKPCPERAGTSLSRDVVTYEVWVLLTCCTSCAALNSHLPSRQLLFAVKLQDGRLSGTLCNMCDMYSETMAQVVDHASSAKVKLPVYVHIGDKALTPVHVGGSGCEASVSMLWSEEDSA